MGRCGGPPASTGPARSKLDPRGELVPLDPDDLRGLLGVVRAYREVTGPFDVLVGGITRDDPAAARAVLDPLAEAGVTWWQETVDPRQTDLETFRARVRQGPPGH